MAEGKSSNAMHMSDMVWQGSVLGPLLWNIFYSDVADSVHSASAIDIIFADDLNCFREYDVTASERSVMHDLVCC